MRSASSGTSGLGPDDLTTRARIRDAAVLRFGREGFGVSVRALAADAGVSPGLVIHHFGSKDGLRAACDEHVLRTAAEAKRKALITGGGGDFLAPHPPNQGDAPPAG